MSPGVARVADKTPNKSQLCLPTTMWRLPDADEARANPLTRVVTAKQP